MCEDILMVIGNLWEKDLNDFFQDSFYCLCSDIHFSSILDENINGIMYLQ